MNARTLCALLTLFAGQAFADRYVIEFSGVPPTFVIDARELMRASTVEPPRAAATPAALPAPVRAPADAVGPLARTVSAPRRARRVMVDPSILEVPVPSPSAEFLAELARHAVSRHADVSAVYGWFLEEPPERALAERVRNAVVRFGATRRKLE